jgi:phosphohistidine phosphatase SixA
MSLEVLYLVRHGKAEASHPAGDLHRVLSDEGRRRTDDLSRQAATRDFRVQIALASPYVRAIQTRDLFLPVRAKVIRLEAPVYAPSSLPDDAIEDLEAREDEGYTRIAVFTHNPFVTLLAERLLVPGTVADLVFHAPTILALGFDRGLRPREGLPLWILHP